MQVRLDSYPWHLGGTQFRKLEQSWGAGFWPSSESRKLKSEMELRNPGLDLAFISKVCQAQYGASHREVNDFIALGYAMRRAWCVLGVDTGPWELTMCLVKGAVASRSLGTPPTHPGILV